MCVRGSDTEIDFLHSPMRSLCSSHTGLLAVPTECEACFHPRAFFLFFPPAWRPSHHRTHPSLHGGLSSNAPPQTGLPTTLSEAGPAAPLHPVLLLFLSYLVLSHIFVSLLLSVSPL